MRFTLLSLVLLTWLLGGLATEVSTADLTANSCVTCHRRADTTKALPAWYQDQFIHWYGSVHGRKGVTCEKCHGGDPTHANKEQAHQGLKGSSDPLSPIYYKNVPEMCGTCHTAVYQHFVQSRHYRNLKADRLAPSCTTCHGFQMDTGAVAFPQIVKRCTICHQPQKVKPEVGPLATRVVDEIAKTDHAVKRARLAIDLALEQGGEVKGVQDSVVAAQERLNKTGALWHNFRLGDFTQELREIRAMADNAYAAAKDEILKK